jgi:hypothetical protein
MLGNVTRKGTPQNSIYDAALQHDNAATAYRTLYQFTLVVHLHIMNHGIISIIISLLMPPLLGHRPSLWITHKENGLVGAANAAGTNSLTCPPKHGRVRDNEFLVTHPMTGQRCVTSAIARRAD